MVAFYADFDGEDPVVPSSDDMNILISKEIEQYKTNQFKQEQKKR